MVGVKSTKPQEVIPYFEGLFARLQKRDPQTCAAFGRHVHWGFWCDPAKAEGTAADYGRAAEEMCQRVCAAADIGDWQHILDVGCGFGGSIASLNERFANMHLTGINIDARQIERARATIQPANNNILEFVHGNAMELPFADASFDVVMAVECIFHFPDRERFFVEASRVLKPHGILVVSDFVPAEETLPLLRAYDPGTDPNLRLTFGKLNVQCSSAAYHQLSQQAGMVMVKEDDISVHTMPTYSFLRRYLRSIDEPNAELCEKATGQLEKTCRKGWLRYSILTFRKLTMPVMAVA